MSNGEDCFTRRITWEHNMGWVNGKTYFETHSNSDGLDSLHVLIVRAGPALLSYRISYLLLIFGDLSLFHMCLYRNVVYKILADNMLKFIFFQEIKISASLLLLVPQEGYVSWITLFIWHFMWILPDMIHNKYQALISQKNKTNVLPLPTLG